MLRAPSSVVAMVVFGVLWAVPVGADEPVREDRFRPGAYPPASARASLALWGGAITAGWYTAALVPALVFPDAPGAEDLRIPVVGPWLALADTGCAADEPDCSTLWVVVRAILTGIDGVGQVGGVAVLLEAGLMPTAAQSQPASSRTGAVRKPSRVELRVLPWAAGREGVGLAIAGRM